ncbi:MAG: type II toxin-antitoxin system RelE/ParE family toxin [Spirochaetia bacterium]|nr:type II toxin-antitoxin system RelE/ParE family toxin [Spirochaetia bacterium]
MKIEFSTIAYEEFKSAIEYYELQEIGLGIRFKYEVNESLKRIKRYPEAWQQETKSTRRFLLKRFPYKIVYYLENEIIIIVAVAHTHRKPFYWI